MQSRAEQCYLHIQMSLHDMINLHDNDNDNDNEMTMTMK